MIHLICYVGIRSCLQQQLDALNEASETSSNKGCPSTLQAQSTYNGDNDQMIHNPNARPIRLKNVKCAVYVGLAQTVYGIYCI